MDRLLDEMREFRRKLHQYPELSEKEFQTATWIIEKLEEWGIPYRRSIGQGVVAWVEKGTGKSIGFRADMDALPIVEDPENPYCSKNSGVMHACGHDYHVSIHLYLLRLAQLSDFQGTLKVFFQPAEETIGGAEEMVKDRVLENPKVDKVLCLHLQPGHEAGVVALKAGEINAATATLKIKVKGSSSHGAYPHLGVDAILVSAYLITQLQSLVSRSTNPVCPVVVSLGQIAGGCKDNVLAGEVNLSGTVRTLCTHVMKDLEEKMQRLAKGIGISHGAEIDLQLIPGYPLLTNDEALHETVKAVAEEFLGKEKVHEMPQPSMGADDFAYFSQQVPGYYYFLGCGRKGEENYPLHHEKFQACESCLELGLGLQWKIFRSLLER